MKKAITIILVISLCISSCSYASDYHIEWFDIEDVSRVQYLDEERIAVFTDTLAKDELAALCDYNGNPLTEFDYTFILRLKKGLYTGASVYFVNPANKESKIDAFDIDGNIIESVPCEFEKENWCLIPGENLQADISAFEEKNFERGDAHFFDESRNMSNRFH